MDLINQSPTSLASLLHQIVEDSQTAVLVLDAVRDDQGEFLDFRFAFINPAGEAILGLPADELRERSFVAHFSQGGGLLDVYRTVLESGQTTRLSQVRYEGDGVSGWFDVKAQKYNDSIIITFADITALKEAEHQKQQQAAFLNQLLDTSPHAVIAYQAIREKAASGQPTSIIDLRTVFSNSAYQQIFNEPAEAISTRTFRQRFTDAGSQDLLPFYIQCLEKGEGFRRERFYPHLNKWLDVTGTVWNDGLMLVISDITVRKQFEIQLSHSNTLLQSTLDASISSILAMTAIRNENGKIVDFRMDKANQAVEKSLSRKPDELEGRTLLEVFPGNEENGFFDLYTKAAETGIPQQATLHYTDINGFEGWFEVSAVQQAQDKIVLTFMNVTASKRLERQLLESNANLNQFASIASHDLQEPLRKVQAFSDILMNEYAPALGEGTALLQRMQLATNRMQTLIRDLLAYSRLTKNAAVTHLPQDLNELVEEVLNDLEVTIKETGAQIEVEPLPVVTGDGLQLRQAFQNLVANALKFHKPGQAPKIAIRAKERLRSELPADMQLVEKSHQRYWAITVADNGIGFNDAYRERIFGAFERLHGRSSPYSGSGIGLAIVRKVMENHEGGVTALGREGEGATFILYFPVLSIPSKIHL